MNGLFGAGLILLAVAAVADLAGWRKGPPYLLGAAGSACLAVAGGFALAGRTVRLPVAGWLGQPVWRTLAVLGRPPGWLAGPMPRPARGRASTAALGGLRSLRWPRARWRSRR